MRAHLLAVACRSGLHGALGSVAVTFFCLAILVLLGIVVVCVRFLVKGGRP